MASGPNKVNYFLSVLVHLHSVCLFNNQAPSFTARNLPFRLSNEKFAHMKQTLAGGILLTKDFIGYFIVYSVLHRLT